MTLFGQPKGREIDERTPIRTSRPRNCRRPYTAMLEFGESPPKNPTVMGSKSVLKYGPPHGDLCRQAAPAATPQVLCLIDVGIAVAARKPAPYSL